MEEILDLYDELDATIPVDVLTKAVVDYGFIIEDNYPLEDEFYGK